MLCSTYKLLNLWCTLYLVYNYGDGSLFIFISLTVPVQVSGYLTGLRVYDFSTFSTFSEHCGNTKDGEEKRDLNEMV